MKSTPPKSGATLLILALLSAACAGDAASASSPEPSPLVAAPAETPVHREADAFIGVVVARQHVDISFPVTARLARVAVRVGDSVEVGQVLAELDAVELDADIARADGALREARAAHRQARVGLRAARTAVKRTRALVAEGAVAANDARDAVFAAERAASAVSSAAAAIDQREAELAKLRELRERTTLRAPLAGRVSTRAFDDGATVPASAAVVGLISSERDVRFAVPPDQTAGITSDSRVRVQLEDRTWTATVTSVAPHVDLASQLVFAEASFDPEQADLPNVGTRVRARVAP